MPADRDPGATGHDAPPLPVVPVRWEMHGKFVIAAASEADAERALAVLERAGKGSMAAAVTIQMEICVDPARQIVTWLRSHRRGAHGGAFTCVDDVIAAIEWQFGEEDRDVH